MKKACVKRKIYFAKRAPTLAACLLLFCCACAPRTAGEDARETVAPQTTAQADPVVPAETPAAAEKNTEALMADAACMVECINVGYGASALVRVGGKAYLIDTGEDTATPKVLGALHAQGVTKLDGVFLTHTHSDHTGGFEEIAKRIEIAQVYRAEISENKENGENKIDNLAADAGIPRTLLHAGNSLEAAPGAVFEVLGPTEYNEDDDNDNSLVLRLTVAGKRFLFTGDMQFAEEETLLFSGTDCKADVLFVGNHGNPDATGDAFGAAVSPAYAVISTDRMVDDDSANARVIAALPDAQTFITDEFQAGILFVLAAGGSLHLTDPVRATALRLSVVSADPETQIAVIRNEGEEADLSGCMLLSERGGQLFVFPQGTRLAAGTSLTVAAEGRSGDLIWTGETKPWHQKKADAALLYDAFGNLLDRLD